MNNVFCLMTERDIAAVRNLRIGEMYVNVESRLYVIVRLPGGYIVNLYWWNLDIEKVTTETTCFVPLSAFVNPESVQESDKSNQERSQTCVG